MTILVCAAVVVAAVVVLARRCPAPIPTIGVYDASDAVAFVVAVVLAPFLFLVVPAWIAGLLFAILIVVSIGDVLAPTGRSWPVRSAVSLGFTALAFAMDVGDVAAAWVVVDLALVAVLGIGVGVWLQAGLTMNHVVHLSVFLVAYDVVATHLTGLMARLLDRLGDVPLGLVFEAHLGGRVVLLGLGDVMFMSMAIGAAFATYSRGAAWIVTGAISIGFAASTALVLRGDDVVVPVMVTLGPATWAGVGVVALLGRLRSRPPVPSRGVRVSAGRVVAHVNA